MSPIPWRSPASSHPSSPPPPPPPPAVVYAGYLNVVGPLHPQEQRSASSRTSRSFTLTCTMCGVDGLA
eukprot:2327895-Pyramimonas_sp.AAC.1